MRLKINKSILLILLLFGAIYCLIALYNHYLFRTYALDLGLYTNAIFKYAHFRLASSQMIYDYSEPLLGDHFDLYLIILSPIVYILGSYTLPVIQIIAILAGGLGIYKYFNLNGIRHSFLPIAATLYFLLFFGVYSAISFDYHSNVVAAMLIPWFLILLKQEKYRLAALLLLLILVAKENMALWMIFVCSGLMIESRENKKAVILLSAFALFSLLYFLAVIYFIIPAFTESGKYNLFSYSILGHSPADALKNLFLHPMKYISNFFTNHTANPAGDYIKTEMHILVLVSGLYLLLTRPAYLIMLIPIYLQKAYHDNYQVWGIFGQYSIEFAPVMAIGIFSFINDLKKKKTALWLSALVIAGAALATFRTMDHSVMYTQKSKIRFYQAAHYSRKYNVKTVYLELDKIPSGAAVSAQSPFVPHLALRDKIYQFPVIKDADYIVLSLNEDKFPLKEEEFTAKLKEINASGEWEETFSGEGLLVFEKVVSH